MTPPTPDENRRADMIQVFFAAQISDAEILRIFQHATGLMQAGLAQYAKIPHNITAYSEYTNSPLPCALMPGCYFYRLGVVAKLVNTDSLTRRKRRGWPALENQFPAPVPT